MLVLESKFPRVSGSDVQKMKKREKLYLKKGEKKIILPLLFVLFLLSGLDGIHLAGEG